MCLEAQDLLGLTLSVGFSVYPCSCSTAHRLRGDTVAVVTLVCSSAVTLLVHSQPLPEAANGFAHSEEGRMEARGAG